MSISSPIRLGGIFLMLMVAAAGCRCGSEGVGRSYGEIGVVHLDAFGATITGRDALYDFGTLQMGDRVQKKLVIRNLGQGALTLISLERTEGSAVTIGDIAAENAAFDVRFVTSTVIEAGNYAEFDMAFTPPHGSGNVSHEVKLLLSAGGTRPEEETAVITLRGKATPGACEIPEVLDFGKVALGAHGARTVTFRNPGGTASQAFVGDPESANGDHLTFKVGEGSPKGNFEIGPGGSQDITVEFRPTELRAYEATVALRASGHCGPGQVTLKGEGVDEVLEWTPDSLNFGYIAPSTEAIKIVTFTNRGGSDVELYEVATTAPADFGYKVENGDAPGKFVVPANTSREMKVVCKPSQLGPRAGTLRFRTPITKQPMGQISLTCFGGGPDIRVLPNGTLNFGRTAFFQSSNPPYAVTRKITVMNVGAIPPNMDPNGNLKLGRFSPEGEPGQVPYMALVPLNGNTQQSEFSIGIPPTYNPATGIVATAGQNAIDLTLTLTPKSLGQKEAELLIYSNDPDTPEYRLLVTATVEEVPPCKYTVSPQQVSFGLVTPGTQKEVPVTFTNIGTLPNEICLISGVDLAPGTDMAYSMPNGPVESRELQPGQSFQALVRVAPQGQVPNAVVNLTGNLRYFASSPTAPSGTVPLVTNVGPTCLTIAPAHEEFGAAKPGCNTPVRTFSIYNVCTQSVSLQGITMQVGAGQGPGGPNCPGTAACPEFFLTQTPAIPGGGLSIAPGSNPVNFQARYRPIDIGPDSGVIAVNVVQSGQNVTYLVTLAGSGDATGQNTDIFVQDFQPKADVLFTIDDSCSMDVYQNSLANNFASFIQYAVAAGVDWQIGVTTTDMDDAFNIPGFPAFPEGEKGRLIGDANNPKILTPNTPNVQALFQQKVKVGTDGSGTETGLEPSLAAVTPPLITADNAGFLRQDANLAIVVVTDAPDQSGKPASFYLNSFLNVKGHHRAHMFTFNAIAGFAPTPPSGCPGYDTGADDGSYAFVVNQTNGIRDEICTNNWSATLQNLGKTAFGFRTVFYLNAVPDLTQGVTVLLNGVAVPASSGGKTNWSYDAASNAIVFDPQVTPGPGDTLTVSYTVGCLP